jgi:hypothetical protein
MFRLSTLSSASIISEILSKYLGLQHRCLSFGLLYIVTVLAKIQNNISRKSVRYESLCSGLTHGRTGQGFSQLSSCIWSLRNGCFTRIQPHLHILFTTVLRWCRRGVGVNYRGLTVREGPGARLCCIHFYTVNCRKNLFFWIDCFKNVALFKILK